MYVPCMFDYSNLPPGQQDPGAAEADICVNEERIADASTRRRLALPRDIEVGQVRIRKGDGRKEEAAARAEHEQQNESDQRRQYGRIKDNPMEILATFKRPGDCSFRSYLFPVLFRFLLTRGIRLARSRTLPSGSW